jgi:hypothetical protein
MEKIEKGLRSENVDHPMTEKDRRRLLKKGEVRKSLPDSEWNEWSRRIHHALQVAFIDDTDRMNDMDALDEWRKHVVSVVHNAYHKERDPLVLENAAAHFVQNDLFRYMKRGDGEIEFSEKEKILARTFGIPLRSRDEVSSGGGSGCAGSVVAMALVVATLLMIA